MHSRAEGPRLFWHSMQWCFQQQLRLPVPRRCSDGPGAVKANHHYAGVLQEGPASHFPLNHCFTPDKTRSAILSCLGCYATVLPGWLSLRQTGLPLPGCPRCVSVSHFSPLYLLRSPTLIALGTCDKLMSQRCSLTLPPHTTLLHPPPCFYFSLSAVSAGLIKDIASPHKPCL